MLKRRRRSDHCHERHDGEGLARSVPQWRASSSFSCRAPARQIRSSLGDAGRAFEAQFGGRLARADIFFLPRGGGSPDEPGLIRVRLAKATGAPLAWAEHVSSAATFDRTSGMCR